MGTNICSCTSPARWKACHYISSNCKYCKVLESAVLLNFAFNICSPINLCLLQVNCALHSGSNLHPSAQAPAAARSPDPTAIGCPRGRGHEGPAGLPGVAGSPGSTSTTRSCCHGPSGHQHRLLCAKTLPVTRPSLGFFFFLIVFKTDFMWSQNETMIVN